ncbi:MAG: hypothetical protein P4M08_01295 [Oligoflexia bacterium]|nr:hypothetical protein [Oligoflexia bacterium]
MTHTLQLQIKNQVNDPCFLLVDDDFEMGLNVMTVEKSGFSSFGIKTIACIANTQPLQYACFHAALGAIRVVVVTDLIHIALDEEVAF